jgi:hypothetical protein
MCHSYHRLKTSDFSGTKHIKKENRKEVALDIYSTFCDEDADDWNPTSHLLKDANIKFDD